MYSLKQTLRSLVILDSRYGIWVAFFLGSPRALITLPKASSPELICTDSVKHKMQKKKIIPVTVTAIKG